MFYIEILLSKTVVNELKTNRTLKDFLDLCQI